MNWQILNTGRASAERNMELDRQLLLKLDAQGPAILRFYDWTGDSATYGYFTTPSKFLKEDAIQHNQLQLARRPTGGGILFHLCDLTFSLLIPADHPDFSLNTLENYCYVNQLIAKAVYRFMGMKEPLQLFELNEKNEIPACNHFCMAQPSMYDVMLKGKKVAGGAQRRTKVGYLHQGTISLAMPPESYLRNVLLPESLVLESMQHYTASILGTDVSPAILTTARRELQECLSHVITQEA